MLRAVSRAPCAVPTRAIHARRSVFEMSFRSTDSWPTLLADADAADLAPAERRVIVVAERPPSSSSLQLAVSVGDVLRVLGDTVGDDELKCESASDVGLVPRAIVRDVTPEEERLAKHFAGLK